MTLTEHQRRAYLEALSIDVWVPRSDAQHDAELETAQIVEQGAGQDAAPGGGSAAGTTPVDALDWHALRDRVAACTLCDLHASRTQTVFGVGSPSADWMLIGEAPGAEEDRRGEPFVGRAGKLLDEMLRAIGQRRDDVFIANILKCRPPGNRDPKPAEARSCRAYLERQVALVEPRIVLALGRIAAQNLLGSDAPVGRLRGRQHALGDVPLVVTYHPAYLLRSPSQKRKVWDDLCLARRILTERA